MWVIKHHNHSKQATALIVVVPFPILLLVPDQRLYIIPETRPLILEMTLTWFHLESLLKFPVQFATEQLREESATIMVRET